MIKNGENPFFVAELETGYVVLGDFQYFKGYSLLLCKEHKTELHFLEEEFKKKFLLEMSLVAEAAYKAFHADKMNYELLGNLEAHMHWHLFPRQFNREHSLEPVWWTDKNIMYSEEVVPPLEELRDLKRSLYEELRKLTDNIYRVGDF